MDVSAVCVVKTSVLSCWHDDDDDDDVYTCLPAGTAGCEEAAGGGGEEEEATISRACGSSAGGGAAEVKAPQMCHNAHHVSKSVTITSVCVFLQRRHSERTALGPGFSQGQ